MNSTKEWLAKYENMIDGTMPESVRRLAAAFDGTIVNEPEDIPFNDIAGLSHTDMVCTCCKQSEWWSDSYGNPKCQTCHPKPTKRI